jgi:hypothetical protein
MLIIESLFVGFYTAIIILLYSFIIKDINLLFFVTGFTKHYLGYYLGAHDYYCQIAGNKTKSNGSNLFLESVAEGAAFVLAGKLINTNEISITGFTIGFIFHILAEFLGIHAYFLNNCI